MEGGPSGFRRGFTCPALLGSPAGKRRASRKGLSPAVARLSRRFRSPSLFPYGRSRNPRGQAPGFGLIRFRSPLLTESIFLSSPPATEMFHFAGYRASSLWIHVEAASWRMPGCPIRTSTDQRPHASPRGFSQLAASFFACRRQGIRHAPVQPGRQIPAPGRTGDRTNPVPCP